MRNFEESFARWEPHFEAYRQLLESRTRVKNPRKILANIEKLWSWLRDNQVLPQELELGHYALYAKELEEGKLCRAVESYAPMTLARLKAHALRWTRHLAAHGLMLTDPLRGLSPGYPGRSVRGRALSTKEVEKLLRAPDTQTPLGMRDQAILEIAYGSGLRLGELASLGLESLDLRDRVINLRDTKNGWDRSVPLTVSARDSLVRYLTEGRPQYWQDRVGTSLWVSVHRRALSEHGIAILPARYRDLVEYDFTMHDLRFTCATHLLEGGAKLPEIARLLGHECLTSTQIYTRARVEELRRVHTTAHPRG